MSRIRHIVVLCVTATTLIGCGTEMGFPKIESSFTVESRNAPWPGFLPVDTILAVDPADFERSQADIRNLQARAYRLKARARVLKGPVLEAQERLRIQQGITLSDG